MKIENDTKFGHCEGCKKLTPRDEMNGANINVFGSEVYELEEVLRIRMCPVCFKKFLEDVKKLKWQVTLHEARHIRIDKDLSAKCDEVEFDDSQEAILAAAKESDF